MELTVIESAESSDGYLRERPDRVRTGSVPVRLELHPAQKFQTFLGFGGAFTEATAYALSFLDSERREEVLRGYFDQAEGNGYRIGRLTVHSCDFSCESYTYMNDRFDRALSTFSVARDETLVLPLIKDAQRVAGDRIAFFASPWSPPSFMKTNNIMCHGGTLRPEYAGMWADYLVRFLQEYASRGVPCFGLTVQNEPEATQTWESCLYSGEEERDFIADHLGPALEASGLPTRVILYDHNRDHIYERGMVAYADPRASRHIWGAGVHWYIHEDFENQARLHDAHPDKHLIFTEGCCGWSTPEGDWASAEHYAFNILNDLNHWVEAWTDWNLVLDEHGGPNHVTNYCAAPVIVDTLRGDIIRQPSYYAIGHFSRYITPGAVRIGHSVTGDTRVQFTTWSVDDHIVVVALNRGDDALDYGIGDRIVTIPGHGVQTLTLVG